MDARTLDLRALVVKYDLERALSETYQDNRIILNELERKTIMQYLGDEYDALEYVRDLLVDGEWSDKEDFKKLFSQTKKQLITTYPDDIMLHANLTELGDAFYSAIDDNSCNNKCLFMPKSIHLK